MRPAFPRAFALLVVFTALVPSTSRAEPALVPLTGTFDTMSRNGQHVITQNAAGDLYHWTPATGQALLGLNLGSSGYVAAVTDDGAVLATNLSLLVLPMLAGAVRSRSAAKMSPKASQT
ncbi:MAG TPA: hypothetical protein VF669_21410 [Tepidisphaeraceae bacterium]|jgi:hypothetical protein